jgi:hypothetical protein
MQKVFYCALILLGLTAAPAHSQKRTQKNPLVPTQVNPGSQTVVPIFLQGKTAGDVSGNDRKMTYDFARPGGIPAEASSSNRFIVKLKEVNPEKNISGRVSLSQRVVDLQEQHEKFRTDFANIQNANARISAKPSRILNEYTNTFNGFTIEGDAVTVQQIRKLSYVAFVAEDRQVKAIDMITNQIIKADQVWAQYNSTGKNVTIGIIDTGIDYFHKDLGGGFGEGFKVRGGYDFVNEDADPMDDHSHGTHVAGIAAGNGDTLKGVAPDATLYAYKVLTAEGYGWESWIIAGIERTVDPDQNPLTDDHLDVVNMSLGGAVGPEDPMSEAVNSAVAAGVTFVIAAGNSYDYETVGTPGVAEKAITVAATDYVDVTAYFSSKGPVANTYAMKPDVAAPGVDVHSSIPGNQYANYSGTSMASPHVAGAVALLLEEHPSWTPDIVKGALMGTASTTMRESVWHQGAGRIDVLEAIKSEFVIAEGSLSLGIVDHSTATWVSARTITLANLSNVNKNFSFSAEGQSVNAGVTVNFSPETVNIAANSSQEITVTFTVNVGQLPMKHYTEGYHGSIIATSGAQTVRAGYSFVHSPVKHLSMNGELPYIVVVVGVGKDNYFTKYVFPQADMEFILPEGNYDFVAKYEGDYYVIKENISMSDTTTLIFEKSQADNIITFNPKDRYGNPMLVDWETASTTIIAGPERNWGQAYWGPVSQIYMSDVSAYSVEYKMFGSQSNDPYKYYDIALASGLGISNSLSLSNEADEFSKITFRNPSIAEGAAQNGQVTILLSEGWALWFTHPWPISNPMIVYASKHELSLNLPGTFARLIPESGQTWETMVWNALSDNSILFSDYYLRELVRIQNTEYDLTLGNSIPNFGGQLIFWDEYIYIGDFNEGGYFNHAYGENELSEGTFELISQGDIIKSGTFINKGLFDWTSGIQLQSPQDAYKLKLHYPQYHLDENMTGVVDTELVFDTRPSMNLTPLVLQRLTLEVDGEHTNVYENSHAATISFRLTHCVWPGCTGENLNLKSAHLFYRGHDGSDWTELTLVNDLEGEFDVILPEYSMSGYYDLKLTAETNAGASLLYEVKPAFLVTNESAITLLSPLNGEHSAGLTPVLKWASSDESMTAYTLQVSESLSFQNYFFDDTVNDSEKALTVEGGKTYYWRVKDATKTGGWSQTFSFGNSHIQLLSPDAMAPNMPTSVAFSWNAIQPADNFRLLIAEDEDFSINVRSITLVENARVVENLDYSTRYYWKVEATQGAITVSSSIRYFTTTQQTIQLLAPANNSAGVPLTSNFSWTAIDGVSYLFQLSPNQNFNSFHSQIIVAGNSVEISKMDPSTTYFWRVKPVCDACTWSEVYKFTTHIPVIELIEPVEQEADGSFTTATLSWKDVEDVTYGYVTIVATDPNFQNVHGSYQQNFNFVIVGALTPATTYYWKVGAYFNNITVWSTTASFTAENILEVSDLPVTQVEAYPNPATGLVNIKFFASKRMNVSFHVVNPLGHAVYNENIGQVNGLTIVQWDATDQNGTAVADGVYFVILKTDTGSIPLKVVLKR